MKKIRIGKDITARWKITTNGEAASLAGRDLTLYMREPNGKGRTLDFSVEGGNVVVFTYHGIEQKNLGVYSLTLWENKGKIGQTAVDQTKAFQLVANTDEED